MNTQTKLVFALEHVAHLHDLIEDNEFELERQLANELHRKNPKLGEKLQGYSNKEAIKEGIGAIGRISDQES